jgi:hypothetical protein
VVSPVIAAVVDWGGLLEVIWVSLLAGIGVTVAFAFAILGATRAVEMRRDGSVVAAGGYYALMVAGLLVVTGAVVFALVLMAQ